MGLSAEEFICGRLIPGHQWAPRRKNEKVVVLFDKNSLKFKLLAETYSEPCQICKNETFAKNSLKPLIVFTKNSILNVWQHSEYAYVLQAQILLFSEKQNFFKKYLTRRKNQIKCINTCAFNLILAQGQILSNH